MTYFIEKQTSVFVDLQGFFFGVQFAIQFGKPQNAFVIVDEMGTVVKQHFTTYEEAKRYCQEMEYDIE